MNRQEAIQTFELLAREIQIAERNFQYGNRTTTIGMLEAARDSVQLLLEYAESKPWVDGASTRLGAWPAD